jgi:protein involved in polysaccharide export with SLBB domain
LKTKRKVILSVLISLVVGLVLVIGSTASVLANDKSQQEPSAGQQSKPNFGNRIEGTVNADTTLAVGDSLTITITASGDDTTLAAGQSVMVIARPSGTSDDDQSNNPQGKPDFGNLIKGTVNADTTLAVGDSLTITITDSGDDTTLTSGQSVSVMVMPSGMSDTNPPAESQGMPGFGNRIEGTVNADTTLAVGDSLTITITASGDDTTLTSGQSVMVIARPSGTSDDDQSNNPQGKPNFGNLIKGTVNADTTLAVGDSLTITITASGDDTTLTSGQSVSVMVMPSGMSDTNPPAESQGMPGFGNRIEGTVNADTTLAVGDSLTITITASGDDTTLTSDQSVIVMVMSSGTSDANPSTESQGKPNFGNWIKGTVNADTTLAVGDSLTITITDSGDDTTLTSGQSVSVMVMPSGMSDTNPPAESQGMPGFGNRIEGTVNADTTLAVGDSLTITITASGDDTTLTSGQSVSVMVMPSGTSDANPPTESSDKPNFGNWIKGTVDSDTTLAVGDSLTITITACGDDTTLTSGQSIGIMVMPSGMSDDGQSNNSQGGHGGNHMGMRPNN